MDQLKEVKTEQDWNELYEKSQQEKVLLFKHSTQCPVSAEAFEEFQAFVKENSDHTYAYVKVIESRPISNQIAEDLNTVHKSPQLFILENKEVKWTESHWNIKKKAIAKVI